MLLNIFLYLIFEFILCIASIFIGLSLFIFFYIIYFEEYYCYVTYANIFIIFIFLIIKKKYFVISSAATFLIITGFVSYAVYTLHFNTRISKKEKIKIVEKLEKQCKDERENTDNLKCKRYFDLYDRCKEKNDKALPIDCKELIVNGVLIM